MEKQTYVQSELYFINFLGAWVSGSESSDRKATFSSDQRSKKILQQKIIVLISLAIRWLVHLLFKWSAHLSYSIARVLRFFYRLLV